MTIINYSIAYCKEFLTIVHGISLYKYRTQTSLTAHTINIERVK